MPEALHMTSAIVPAGAHPPLRLRTTASERIAWIALGAVALLLLAFLAAPLLALLVKAVQDPQGGFV